MKTRFCFVDPGAIMGAVIALIVLAVGVFAFFVTSNEINSTIGHGSLYQPTENAVKNITSTGNSVFNIIGIVMIIGAIMSIVGIVYNYVR